MAKEHIGTKIRERRKELGLKVYELANKVGIDPVYVTQIEKHGKLPSPEVFMKIEKTLDLPIEIRNKYLFDKYFESVGSNLFTPATPNKTISMEILEELESVGGENSLLQTYSRIIGSHPDAPALHKKLQIVIKKFKNAINESESFYTTLKKNFGNKGKPL